MDLINNKYFYTFFNCLGVDEVKSIFIVEDNDDLRALYKKILNFNGHRKVFCSKNGMDALEKFKRFSEKPEIILMDYRMPGKNGIDVAKEIFEIDKKVKIIMISGDNHVRKLAISTGISHFIEKESSIKKTVEILKNVINHFDKSLE